MFFGLEAIKRVKVYYATTISLASRGVNARCRRASPSCSKPHLDGLFAGKPQKDVADCDEHAMFNEKSAKKSNACRRVYSSSNGESGAPNIHLGC
jgi:hypothetical protein